MLRLARGGRHRPVLRHPRIGYQVDAAPAVGRHGGGRRLGQLSAEEFAGSEKLQNDPRRYFFSLCSLWLVANAEFKQMATPNQLVFSYLSVLSAP